MATEIINWLQDVGQHLRVRKQRKTLRQLGEGIDYTQAKYADVVWRVVSRLHPNRMQLRVTKIVQETPSTKTFHFERLDGAVPPFRPGQYVNLFVDVDGILTSRPYSISSPPETGRMTLTVRDKTGGFVAPFLLNQLQVGDEVESSGPSGSFYYEPLIDGEDLVFLAGGSGITPFMSIIRDGLHRQLPLHISLIYGSRTPDDVIFRQELEELATNHDNFSYSLIISEPETGYAGLTGLLDADLIRKQLAVPRGGSDRNLSGKTFYICGPGAMFDLCLSALEELGVPPHKIRRELYGPPLVVTKEPDWPNEIAEEAIFSVMLENGQTIRAPANEPLMNSLERYGIVVPAICRTGACSACRIRLLSGDIYMPSHTGLRESDRQHGFIHACVSYPLTDLQIRL